MNTVVLWLLVAIGSVLLLRRLRSRILLIRAKGFSLLGHPRFAKRVARLVPLYEFDDERFFESDGASEVVVQQRRTAFSRLAHHFQTSAPATVAWNERVEPGVSDLQFTAQYRVPFQYRRYVSERFPIGAVLRSSSGVQVTNLDGQISYDLTGSYGVNLFGYDFYKTCIDAGAERVRDLGPFLGSYHPLIEDNVRRLKTISGMDEVSFHMSGTEAVMQAVRLARYHTKRSHVVRFCGAYHGWWDDVQPGVGNPATVHGTYTLREMDERTLRVLNSRRDIACVLVNPLQALHPNGNPSGDGSLVAGDRRASLDREAYAEWLTDLRAACTRRSIVLIFDEVFVGFRLAYRGAQEYFGIEADMVTYGKTLGGGLPVGVLCGRSRFMKRFRDDTPSDICFARGTFNSHPYVMGAMNEFLRRLDEPAQQETYRGLEERWNGFARRLNDRLGAERLPLRVSNLVSIWSVRHEAPSRYNWMLQYYLRAHGLALSWIGSGRLIFSHNYSDAEMYDVCDRFVRAALDMRDDGWWWHPEGATDRSIHRQVLREMLAARWPFSRWRIGTAHAASSDTIGSNSSPRTT